MSDRFEDIDRIIRNEEEGMTRNKGTREGVLAYHRHLFALSLRVRIAGAITEEEKMAELMNEVRRMEEEAGYCGEYTHFIEDFDRQVEARRAATAD